MKFLISSMIAIFVLSASSARADPVGYFSVRGANPGGQGAYEGQVAVKRTGDTYAVAWKIGNDEFVGTGIGAASVNGVATFGDAAGQDTAIAVSYVSGSSFGLALFVEQDDGHWKGIWTYAGSDAIGSETWTPN